MAVTGRPTADRPRTLADAIRRLTPTALADIFALRPDLADPAPRDIGDVVQRATTAASVGNALDRLDSWQLQVLRAVAALPDPTRADDVARLLAVDRAPVARTLAELSARALVWGDDELHLVRAAREAFGPYPGGLATPSARPLSESRIDAALDACGPDAAPVLERLMWAAAATYQRADRPPDPAAASPLERLLAHGLLRAVDRDVVVMPREVALLLRGGRLTRGPVAPEPVVRTTRPRSADLIQRASVGAAIEVVQDVDVVVHEIASAAPTMLRTGGLPSRDVTALARALDVPAARVVFLVEVAAAADLLAVTSGSLLATDRYPGWARAGLYDRWLKLASGWLASPRHFARSARAGGRPLGPQQESAALPELRRTLLRLALTGAPGNAEVDILSLGDALAWHRPRLTGDGVNTEPAAEFTGSAWHEAAWLGLVALGAPTALIAALEAQAAPGDGAFDDTELAAQFPATVQEIVLQNDLTAVAPGPLSHAVVSELRLLADQESRGAGGVFRFSSRSLQRAMSAGRSAPAVEEWLAEHSRTPLPQPLRYLLHEVARRHGAVRVGTASAYIRLDDEAEAVALLGHPDAAALGLRELAPGVLVATAEPEEVAAMLLALGHAPVVEDAAGAAVPNPGPTASRASTAVSAGRVSPTQLAERLLALESKRNPRARADEIATDDTLAVLRDAVDRALPIRISYVGRDGAAQQRRVSPLDLSDGTIRAVDRESAELVTIPLARVAGAVKDGSRD